MKPKKTNRTKAAPKSKGRTSSTARTASARSTSRTGAGSAGTSAKARKTVSAVPKGYHTATPYLVVAGADRALDYYRRAFNAKERSRMAGPDGKIVHAEFQIGDSIFMLSEECPEMGQVSPLKLSGSATSVFLYVKDVDSQFRQAIAAGGKEIMAPQDMFWGDRFGKLADPHGHQWAMATHREDVSPAEMGKRAQAFFAQQSKQH